MIGRRVDLSTYCGRCEECGWQLHWQADHADHPACPTCGHCLRVHDRDRSAGEMARIYLIDPSFWALVVIPTLLVLVGMLAGWW